MIRYLGGTLLVAITVFYFLIYDPETMHSFSFNTSPVEPAEFLFDFEEVVLKANCVWYRGGVVFKPSANDDEIRASLTLLAETNQKDYCAVFLSGYLFPDNAKKKPLLTVTIPPKGSEIIFQANPSVRDLLKRYPPEKETLLWESQVQVDNIIKKIRASNDRQQAAHKKLTEAGATP